MKLITTRTRAILVSSVTTFVFLLGIARIIVWQPGLAVTEDNTTQNLFIGVLVSVLLALGTSWVLFFKSKNKSLLILSLFPGVAIFPFILLADSIVSTIFADLGKAAVTLIITGLYWLISYLLILTSNVLSGSLIFSIPLGQAGKAAQFIFSLISAYMLIAFLFGAAFPIEIRILGVCAFVFYYSYACVYVLQVSNYQMLLVSIAVTLLMGLVIAVLSVWPIGSVYATLTAVVLLYVMLSVALEIRPKISNAIWVEYAVLFMLVIVILCVYGNWGINGSLL